MYGEIIWDTFDKDILQKANRILKIDAGRLCSLRVVKNVASCVLFVVVSRLSKEESQIRTHPTCGVGKETSVNALQYKKLKHILERLEASKSDMH